MSTGKRTGKRANDSTASKYDYSLDTLGRRTAVVYTGSAFGSGHHNDYGYNDRSELTEADRKTGTTPDSGTPMTPGDYDYLYDNIGNRETYTLDTATTYYCPTDLNQYKYAGPTPPTCTTVTPNLEYDDDGNLTADGTYAYTWDAENRLISVGPVSTPVNNDKKLEFKYDYMGRRVEKVYSVYDVPNQTPDAWVLTKTQRFVYDGWNVTLVLDENNDTLRKYTWGLDMSQSIHGAGGIGGLLAVEETSATGAPDYWFFYDGNGNVGQVIDASDYSIDAKYEYDPYGGLIAKSGDYANANPMRFSTKWFDDELAGTGVNGAVGESGLGYWGYRYYSPRLGRWPNRDPLGARVGLLKAGKPLDEHNSRFREHHATTETTRPRIRGWSGSVPRDNLHPFDPPVQYVDGMNLYQYVGNSPSDVSDPVGLDRYRGNEGLHEWVAVDRWRCAGGRFQRTGEVMRFDFSVDWDGLWPIGVVLYPGRVVLTELNGSPGGTREAVSPCGDLVMAHWLFDRLANPPLYSALLYNCTHFVRDAWSRGRRCPNTLACPDCCRQGRYIATCHTLWSW